MKKNILFILLFFIFNTSLAETKVTLDIAKIADTPDQDVGAKLLKVIYSRINIDINIIDYPGIRLTEESTKGRVAGEVHRLYIYGERHSTLIRVTPAINYIQPTAFSNNKNIKIIDWKSLEKYRIGIIKGVVHSEEGTKGMPHVESVSSIEQLAQMTDTKRIDVFVTDKFNGQVILKKLKLNNSIEPLTPPLHNRIDIYHYLHQKHKDLVPKVEKVIKTMEKNGELEALRKKYRQELLSNIK